MNTLDSQMAEELYEALIELDADSKVRVVLLKGAGKAFCAGIDVNELQGKSALDYRKWIERMERPLEIKISDRSCTPANILYKSVK